MALGPSPTVAANMYNALLRNTSFTGPAALWVQLHVGDPGVNGTSSIAHATARHTVSFGAQLNTGISQNSGSITWTTGEITVVETPAFFSLWDASTSGNFLYSGTITSVPTVVGQTFVIPSGVLQIGTTIAG